MNAKLIHSRKFLCLDCQQQAPVDFETIKRHVEQAHGLATEPLKGRKSLVMALDSGGGEYSNVYNWNFGTVKIQEISSGKRAPAPPKIDPQSQLKL